MRDDSLRSSESEKRNLTCHAPKIEKEAEHLIKNGHCYMIILPTGNSKPVWVISKTMAIIKIGRGKLDKVESISSADIQKQM